jgi:hypothetical protein
LFSEAKSASGARRGELLNLMSEEIEDNPHLYAVHADGDPYNWIENLGGYSPIMHLQQTDGTYSSHNPFTEEYNKAGIIDGKKVLKALDVAYRNDKDKSMPPKCTDIFLTIEVFSATADIPAVLLRNLEKTVEYWRKYIPEDGLGLNELLVNAY